VALRALGSSGKEERKGGRQKRVREREREKEGKNQKNKKICFFPKNLIWHKLVWWK
jgi:hypothetical protein